MASTNSLSDTLAAAASSIGGLLSQMEGALGSGLPSNDLFSNMLSENTTLNASLSPTPTSTSQISASSASGFGNQSLTSSSSNPLLQTLGNLAANLRKALAQLHQQNDNASTAQNQKTQNENVQASATASAASNTQSTDVAQNNTLPTTSVEATAQNNSENTASAPTSSSGGTPSTDDTSTTTSSDTSSTPDDKKALTDILAELLMLTQMVIKNIQQSQSATGGTSTTTSDVTTTAPSVSGGSATSGPKSPLDQLVAALEKTTEILQEVATAKDNVTTSADAQTKSFSLFATGLQQALNGDAASANQAIDAFDMQTQLAALSAKLKNTLANLQEQNKATIAKEPLVANAPTTMAASAPVKNVPVSLDESAQNLSTPKVLAAQNASASISAQPLSPGEPQSSNTSTASQTLVAGEALALSAGKENSTDFSGGLDMSGGEKNTPSFNNSNSNITAGGAQVSGTYNFASTLSAARALNGGTVGLPTVVDQVILQMNRSVKNGNDQMSLQLQPGDLGKITVKLDFSADGKVQGTVTADNPQTLSLLQKDSRSLERALQDAGLRADPGSLQFNLGGQAGQNSGQTGHNGGNANNTTGNGTVSAQNSGDESGLVDLSTIAETYYITPSGVNIQV